jgi:hypothetical protein
MTASVDPDLRPREWSAGSPAQGGQEFGYRRPEYEDRHPVFGKMLTQAADKRPSAASHVFAKLLYLTVARAHPFQAAKPGR